VHPSPLALLEPLVELSPPLRLELSLSRRGSLLVELPLLFLSDLPEALC